MNLSEHYEMFMPHGMCFLWLPELMALHIISDALIALSYFSIPFAILRFVRGRDDLEPRHRQMALLFAAFIALCGLTHVLSIYVLWVPVYVFEGWLKAVTAIVSVATAIILMKLVPHALKLPSAASMRAEIAAHRETMIALDAARAVLASRVDRTEDALRASEAKFQSVVENMSEGLGMFAEDGTVLFLNPAADTLLGHERDADGNLRQDLSAQWQVFDIDGSLVPFESWPIARVLRGERFQNQFVHAERADQAVTFDAIYNGAPIYGPDGKFLLGFVTLRDVRKEVHAQRDLARAHDLLRGFTDAVPGVIYAKDGDGRMLFANDGTAKLIGKPRSEFIGKTDAEFLEDKGQAETVMANDRRIMENGIAEQVEEPVSLPDGTATIWLSTKVPLQNSEGLVTGLIGLSVDISARKATEAELMTLNDRLERQAGELTATNEKLNEALTQRDLLLREVYHRVKNNMQMVDSILVIQKGLLTDPKAKSVLAGLRGRLYAMGLVHQQLMGSPDLRTFDVAPFLRELANNIVIGGASNGVKVNVTADTLDVGLDFAIPLGLLVTELLSNALKHAFPGGEGHIDVGLSRNADGSLSLVVSDDGIGYEQDVGVQGAPAGGLGSKIINALVRQLKATMMIQSDNGTRTEISISAAVT